MHTQAHAQVRTHQATYVRGYACRDISTDIHTHLCSHMPELALEAPLTRSFLFLAFRGGRGRGRVQSQAACSWLLRLTFGYNGLHHTSPRTQARVCLGYL